MSGKCIITNVFTNHTDYTFQPNNGQSSLSSGYWVISPQPIAAKAKDFVCCQAKGHDGTATGAVGVAVFDVMSGSDNLGTLSLNFSDPFDGTNSASASTGVNELVVAPDIPPDGRTITCTWKAK